METPKILHKALRQFRHNNNDELVSGFDYEETIKIFDLMYKALEAQSVLIISYRFDKEPPDWVFDAILAARNYGVKS